MRMALNGICQALGILPGEAPSADVCAMAETLCT